MRIGYEAPGPVGEAQFDPGVQQAGGRHHPVGVLHQDHAHRLPPPRRHSTSRVSLRDTRREARRRRRAAGPGRPPGAARPHDGQPGGLCSQFRTARRLPAGAHTHGSPSQRPGIEKPRPDQTPRGSGVQPACGDRRTPWIVNTAGPGGWPASSREAPGGPAGPVPAGPASRLSHNGRRLTEQAWPHVRLTLSPSGWRGRERAGPALGGCLGGLISGPDPAIAPRLEALRGPQRRFSRPGPLPGHNAPKRSLNRSRAENRHPAARPRVLPAPRPSRPCARPAARPGLPPTSGARRGAVPLSAARRGGQKPRKRGGATGCAGPPAQKPSAPRQRG